ncbi:hypothetical protein CKAH01_10126 [Colletotrichum kahawae]|uniref:Uncharacterized protein n=1 Tax=Colletotrichum kahawae TaxID=34407 RepID=A0AAD9XXV8_COLKA|nr:hypothetical protein CKAH01_10126 [Colletotrichum kahawae]
MTTRLDEIVSSVIEKSKTASVYVLTNGHWNIQDDEKFCLLDYPIGRLVDHVREHRKQRNWVGVQFIRFFENPETQSDQLGRHRLEALDDDLKSKIKDDIVDTTDFNGDVYKMLLGAVSPLEDRAGNNRLGDH